MRLIKNRGRDRPWLAKEIAAKLDDRKLHIHRPTLNIIQIKSLSEHLLS